MELNEDDPHLMVHIACQDGDMHLLRQLVQNGCDINHPLASRDRITPLHQACANGNMEVVKFLVDYGANVNASNVDGMTPLCEAATRGCAKSIVYLIEHGAVVNPPFALASPLHDSTVRGFKTCMKLLINAGANLEATDCYVGTPLHSACAVGNMECVQLLLEEGSNVNATKILKTPLHYAVLHEKPEELIRILHSYGADVNKRDNQGKTPKERTREGTEGYKLLHWYERHPRSLEQLCRLAVRKALGARRLHLADKLPLPQVLIKTIYIDH